GRPACDYCRMILEDRRFGGEVVSRGGRRLIFDATECLAAFVLTDSIAPDRIRSIVAVDHDAPGRRIPASRAVYLHGPLESPMQVQLAAFRSAGSARAAGRGRGEVLSWPQVLDLIGHRWFQGRLHAGGSR